MLARADRATEGGGQTFGPVNRMEPSPSSQVRTPGGNKPGVKLQNQPDDRQEPCPGPQVGMIGLKSPGISTDTGERRGFG